jgi:methionyl aminopeptidase
MTEKNYGGASSFGFKNKQVKEKDVSSLAVENKNKKRIEFAEGELDVDSYLEAGKITKQVREFAKNLVKKDMLLVDVAEKIEGKIVELGGKVAFPVNLSIDDIAAHYTPKLKDEKKVSGLLKVDIGVHVNGCICDIALSLDFSEDGRYKKLIEASEAALKNAIEKVKTRKEKTSLSEIGNEIETTIKNFGFIPISNLSGHSLDNFEIHAGMTIPNYNNSSNKELGEGALAIEPFATLSTGAGLIYEGAGGNIYHVVSDGNIRDNFSREVLSWIKENKKTLPFSQRELEKKFGSRVLFAIANLKKAEIVQEFAQLIEKNHQPISQAETSFIIHDGKVDVLC